MFSLLCVDIMLDMFNFFDVDAIISQGTNTANSLIKHLLCKKHRTFRTLWAKGSRTISLNLILFDMNNPKKNPTIHVENHGVLRRVALPTVALPSTEVIEMGNLVVRCPIGDVRTHVEFNYHMEVILVF
jgi:hypothetical protein